MSFDAKAFMEERFEHRTVEVPVPDLKPWFKDGARPVWKVRGLTGNELARVNEAVEGRRGAVLKKVVEKIQSPNPNEKADAVLEGIGISQETPLTVVRFIELVIAGSVDPPCDLNLALKLNEHFPVEFRQIAMAVLEATGKGAVPGKLQPSGEIPRSDQPSISATPEGDSCSK